MYPCVLSVKRHVAMLTVILFLMPWPVLAASPSGTIITTTGAFIDSGIDTWILANSPGNGLVVDRNGTQTISANVIALAYIGGRIYQENKSLGWWYWNGSGWADATNPLTSSPNGTTIPSASYIIDSSKNIWTVSGGAVEENGQPAGYSANVVRLFYSNGVVYQENNAQGWWSWNGSAWADATNPLSSSPNGTTIPSASHIIDSSKNIWTVSGGVVEENGQPAGYSANVVMLYYSNGVVYQENNAQGWWSWNGSTWADASNPTSSSTANTASSAGTGGPSPAGVSVNLGSPTGNNVPGSLWGVATGALIDNSFAGATDTALQTSAKALNIQSMRFNVNSGGGEGLWEDAIFAGGVNSPNWRYLDPWFQVAPAFWNNSHRIIVGVGPSSGSAQRSPSDWAKVAVQLASHFKAMGMEVFYWEVGNEPDGPVDINTYTASFNAIAQALHNFNPSYKVGGPATSWDNGSYITPWAQKCGSYADFTDWHSYPVNPADDDMTMYQKGIAGEIKNVPSQIAGTAMAGKPYALLEYNMNGNPGADPRQLTYKNAVYTALRLTETYKQSPLFQMGGIWEIMGDSNYGIVGANGHTNSTVIPVGYYLSEAGQAMPGVQVPATVDVSGNLKVFATVNGRNFAIQIVNYSTTATYSIGVTAKISGGNFGGTYNVWQLGSASPNTPQTGKMAYNALLSIPPATVVILTAVQ